VNNVEIANWADFRSWVDADRQVMPVYWRGQKDPAWPLASKFEREILHLAGGWKPEASNLYPYDGRFERDGNRTWAAGFYAGMRDRYLDAFKRASSGLRGPSPALLDTDQWWALGRHHGLVTPLLDWTESPYIAAFFPLTELLKEMGAAGGRISFEGKAVAIFRLFHNECLEGDGLRVVRPLVDELGRMHGQRGLFTWLDSETFFQLEGFCDHTGRGDLLTKFTISDQAVLDGLRDLKSHGIDRRLLFPDLSGAAEHANTLWDEL
jgi:FRG domain